MAGSPSEFSFPRHSPGPGITSLNTSKRAEPSVANPAVADPAQHTAELRLTSQATTPNVQGLTQADWIADCILPCDSAQARAAVILIGGFRECGPYHYRDLGAQLNARSMLVSLTSLFSHDNSSKVTAQFSAHNAMSKAVNSVQQVLLGLPETTPLVFVGFSVGALVALQLAQRFSFRPVAGVITEGAYLKGASKLRALYQWNVARQARKLKGDALEKFVHKELTYTSTPVPAEHRTMEWDLRPRIPVVEQGAILGIEQLRVATLQLLASGVPLPPVFLAHGLHDKSALPRSSDIIKNSVRSRAAEVCRFTNSAHSIALGPEKDSFNKWACDAVEYFLDPRS
jgi:esterase/lipase